MAQLSNERFPVKIHPTANATDVLFYIVVDDTLAKNQNAVYGALYHDLLPTAPAGFDSHFLVYKEPKPREPGMHVWYFAAQREDQDLYNFEFAEADLGGNRFNAVKRTYIIPRSDFSASSPSQGSFMPDSPVGKFGTGTGDPAVIEGYVLAGREQGATGVKEIDSMFVAEVRTYVQRSTIRQLGVDDLNGKMLYSDEELYFRGELVFDPATDNSDPSDDSDPMVAIEDLFADPFHEFWGMQPDGTKRSGKQLSSNWFLVTTEQVVGGEFVDGVVAVNNYTSNEDYHWPAVLDFVEFLDWQRREGGASIHPMVVMKREAYRGPTFTQVSQSWSREPFVITTVNQLLPDSISYSSPFFHLSIPDCLHGEVIPQCEIGNTDPEFIANYGSARVFEPTNKTDWPDEAVVTYDDQQPFRGGFLRTVKLMTPPAGIGGGGGLPLPDESV